MKRTRAAALVLVNWKGVFYERYLLDRHVTALEGTNGAGKTTVMIAAYVVLLPDMARLRFTNLGETGATGGDKGIWGRLGESGRPSYAALDLELADSRRLIAGVHLERKGEPSVEPTPFIITGLDDSIRLQDLMLVTQGEQQVVPELAELRENAGRLGGRLQVFTTARDYFAAMFEKGVTPLRLGTDEERNKLNEMLRTSMTGGISRALTTELRSFLLKEEGGLADTLRQMTANLDACRRTRREVQDSQRLEREIGGVFSAGQAMFAAALAATRERADDMTRRIAEAETACAAAKQAALEAEARLADTDRDLADLAGRREECDSELRHETALLQRLHAALKALSEVERDQTTLEEATALAGHALDLKTAAEGARDARRSELGRANEHHKLAAGGLADLQQGLEELHRRTGAYRQVIRRRDEARAKLGNIELNADALVDQLTDSTAMLSGVDQERRRGAQDLSDAAERRRDHAQVVAALALLVGREPDAATAHSTALDALRTYREQQALAARAKALGRDLESARKTAARQASARSHADALGVTLDSRPAGELIRALLEELESEQRRCSDDERAAAKKGAEAEQVAAAAKDRLAELKQREPLWRDLAARATRLGDAVGLELVDRVGLDKARGLAGETLDLARKREEGLVADRERLHAEARGLLAAGGPFEPDLLRLRDQLGAELFAANYEDAGLDEAGPIEARLGPLAQALVVDDAALAIAALAGRAASLPSVWLVARDADASALTAAPGAPDAGDVVVDEGLAIRVSRIPVHPRIGRKARETRAEELRQEAESCAREVDVARSSRRLAERLVEDGDALLESSAVWLSGDPAKELPEVRRRLTEATAHAEVYRDAAARHAEAARLLVPRIKGHQGLLAESLLLDPPDHGALAAGLAEEHSAALAAQVVITRCAAAAQIVEDRVTVLKRLPLSDEDTARLRDRVAWLVQERDRLGAAIEAIEYVRDNVEALSWSDAPKKLETEQTLIPAVTDQLQQAEAAVAESERLADAAQSEFEARTTAWQELDGTRAAADGQLTASRLRLEETGEIDPTPEAAAEAEASVTRLTTESRGLTARSSELDQERGERVILLKQSVADRKTADDKLGQERREGDPAIERWERLRELAARHHLLSASSLDAGAIRGQVNLVQEARKHKAVLAERLSSAQGAETVLATVQQDRDASDAAFGEVHLELWLVVRDWLRRRLPAQVAEVDDPREALLRLRDQLAGLEERLTRQEDDLRGASEDVARGIDVQVRKARGQVNRLTKNLEGVSFGGIKGIRVRLQPVERMEQVLRALRDGAAQALLFQENIPIEEALDEIFRRYGGGRTGGHRLLDYREYVHLQVEVRRSSGTDWEIANPTRLSTGEAIGVGAALMMVVLTEWERDANLLRGKKTAGSLRFLFLDEANRLSHDNLGVLFDLCQTLDLQLLIAAPEVARAEGNTTYRLVRRTTADGREEVIVSGRRTRVDA